MTKQQSVRGVTGILLIFFVLFSLFAHPLTVFAQESASENTAEQQSQNDGDNTESQNQPDPNIDPPPRLFDDITSESAIGFNRVQDLVNDPYSIIDQSSGAFTWQYPFDIPEGRGGLTPQMGLYYSSSAEFDHSIVGAGWSLGIPVIDRMNEFGAENVYTSNDFSSSLGGQLTAIDVDADGFGLYLPRVNGEAGLRYTRNIDDTWTILDARGMRYEFTDVEAHPDDSSKRYRWHLSSIEDRNGNRIEYHYQASDELAFDDARLYPDKIDYVFLDSGDALFSIEFDLETRDDIMTTYEYGFKQQTTKRVSMVEVYNGVDVLESYELHYDRGENWLRSVLDGITRTTVHMDGSSTIMPRTDFEYTDGPDDWDYEGSFNIGKLIERDKYSDVNGDGYIDHLGSYYETHEVLPEENGLNAQVNLFLGDGYELMDFGADDIPWLPPVPFVHYVETDSVPDIESYGTQIIDVNNDGRDDIIYAVDIADDPAWPLDDPADPTDDDYSIWHMERNGVWINNGIDGWDLDPSWTVPFILYSDEYEGFDDNGARFGDVNGDGLVDVMVSCHQVGEDIYEIDCDDYHSEGGHPLQNGVYINTGSGWELDADFGSIPLPFTYNNNFSFTTGVRVSEINGDGLVDIVRIAHAAIHTGPDAPILPESLEVEVYLGTGFGWELADGWTAPMPEYISYSFELNYATCIESYTDYLDEHPLPFFGHDCLPGIYSGLHFGEVTGDGLVDLIYLNQRVAEETEAYIYPNTGIGWATDSMDFTSALGGGWTDKDNKRSDDYLRFGYIWTVPEPHIPFGFMDVNGDGIDDFIVSSSASNAIAGVYYSRTTNLGNDYSEFRTLDDLRAYNTNADPGLDLLTVIHQEDGAQIDINYSVAGRSELFEDDNPDVRIQPTVVTSLQIDDGLGNQDLISFYYEDAYHYSDENDIRDSSFGGFGQVKMVRDDGSYTVTYSHNANASVLDDDGGELLDSRALAGHVYRQDIFAADGTLLQSTYTNWASELLFEAAPASSARSEFVYRADTAILTPKLDGTYDVIATGMTYSCHETEYICQNISIIEYGVVDYDDALRTFIDIEEDYRRTETVYAESIDAAVLSLPESISAYAFDSSLISEMRYQYDDLPEGEVDAGNRTHERIWIDGLDYAETVTTHDGYGNPLTITDPVGNTTITVYDIYDLYPQTVTNALGHIVSMEFDLASGQVSETVNPNGGSERFVYDGLGRLLEQYNTNAGPEYLVASWVYDDISMPKSVTKYTYLGDGLTGMTVTYLDGMLRPVEVWERHEIDGEPDKFSVIGTAYDQYGNPSIARLPRLYSGYASPEYLGIVDRFATPLTDALITTMTFDALGREVQNETIIGSTVHLYDGAFAKTLTDANGFNKHFYFDGLGRLTRVEEVLVDPDGIEDDELFGTDYYWTGHDKLDWMRDAMGNVRTFLYDGRGLMTSATDLHHPLDWEHGVWNYLYDDAGRMTHMQDGAGSITRYYYDALNRLIGEDNLDTPGPDAQYKYDSYAGCNNGLGMLCYTKKVHALGDIEEVFDYDRIGNLDRHRVRQGADIWSENYAYDQVGNRTGTLHHDGSQSLTIYNSRSLVDRVFHMAPDGSEHQLISSVLYHATGSPLEVTYGDGRVKTYDYDADELYRLRSMNYGDGIQYLTYEYDPVGNITSITSDSSASGYRHLEIEHDSLHRMTRAVQTVTSPFDITWEYNAIGNIIYSSEHGDHEYRFNDPGVYANPHAPTHIGGEELLYDGNGRLISEGDKTLTWDYAGKLANVIVDDGLGGVLEEAYLYNASGSRMQKRDITTGTTVSTPFASYRDDGTNVRVNIPAANLGAVGTMQNGDDLTYAVSDHLNSASVDISAGDGSIREWNMYTPFGDVHDSFHSVDATDNPDAYLGKEQDLSTGLINLNARMYNPEFGVFLSIDPVFLAAGAGHEEQWFTDPQSQNSYAYGRNNPYTFTDPSGELAWLVIPAAIVAFIAIVEVVGTTADVVTTAATVANPNIPQQEKAMTAGLMYAGLQTPGVAGGASAYRAGKAIGNASKASNLADDVYQFGGSKRAKKYFERHSGYRGHDPYSVMKVYDNNVGLDASGWSAGSSLNDPLATMSSHYVLHGKSVGANTLADYGSKAAEFKAGFTKEQWIKDYDRNGRFMGYSVNDGQKQLFMDKGGDIVSFHTLD